VRTIFTNPKFSVVWAVLRIYLGIQWLEAGLEKVGNPVWTGEKAGAAVAGFAKGAIAKAAEGPHPAVKAWYASFLEAFVLPNAKAWSYMVAWGELLVGVALILGAFTVAAALAGAFMNLNFMFAGSASTNPYMYTIAILLLIAGANAGHIGVDRYLMPYLRRLIAERKAVTAAR